MSLLENLGNTSRGKAWLDVLDERCKSALIDIGSKLDSGWKSGMCYPPVDLVMKPFHIVAPEEVRLVVICKEPYTGQMATGIPVEANADIVPKSARYFIDLISRYWIGVSSSNFMKCYYASGMLVINASFTIQKSEDKRYSLANSHFPLWANFTRPFVKLLVGRQYPILALGVEAKTLLRNMETKAPVYYSSFPRDDKTRDDFIANAMEAIDTHIYSRESRGY
jgi:uracil DNA glycosylase